MQEPKFTDALRDRQAEVLENTRCFAKSNATSPTHVLSPPN